MTLSTARPSAGTVAAELTPATVDFAPEKPPVPVVGAPAAPAPLVRGMMEKADEQSAQSATARSRLGDLAIQQATAQIEASPFQVLYSLTGPQTIPNSGETKRVVIDQTDLDPALSVRATPKVEPKAYLYAKLELESGLVLLPGQTSLFRDGVFVGRGVLPQLAGGEDHELGFGADDKVRVKFTTLDKTTSETGIISSSSVETQQFKTTVQNLHARAVNVTVYDQLPVSANEDIQVTLTSGSTPTTKQNVEDKRGVVAWDLKLDPEQEAEIGFGYQVSWPKEKRVQYYNR